MPHVLSPLWKTDLAKLSEDEVWEHYAKCLAAHDWLYVYSDDAEVWSVCFKQHVHLRDLVFLTIKYDEKRSDEMYNAACPYAEKDGTYNEDF